MWAAGDFDLGPTLGRGSFGHVCLARERGSQNIAVLKVLSKRRVERLHGRRHIAREVDIQRHLRHPGVLRMFGFFWDASRIYLILEHAANGDLAQLLGRQQGGRLGESTASSIAAQVAGALEYCHTCHVIHRDVKPSNVLLSRRWSAKLGDFGWAVHAAPSEPRRTLCGTLDYMAPEMVCATNGHSFPVDAWALGVVVFEMLVGKPPFAAPTHDGTCRSILAADLPALPEGSCPDARDLLGRLLAREPADRLTAEGAAAHAWMASREDESLGADSWIASLGG